MCVNGLLGGFAWVHGSPSFAPRDPRHVVGIRRPWYRPWFLGWTASLSIPSPKRVCNLWKKGQGTPSTPKANLLPSLPASSSALPPSPALAGDHGACSFVLQVEFLPNCQDQLLEAKGGQNPP